MPATSRVLSEKTTAALAIALDVRKVFLWSRGFVCQVRLGRSLGGFVTLYRPCVADKLLSRITA